VTRPANATPDALFPVALALAVLAFGLLFDKMAFAEPPQTQQSPPQITRGGPSLALSSQNAEEHQQQHNAQRDAE